MRVPRIFTDQPLAEGLEVALSQGAARHLTSALRLGANSKVVLFNGEGGEFSARLIETSNKKNTTALIEKFSPGIPPSPLALTLAIAISRGERMDWIVQKAVELGVRDIVLLTTERCEVKLNPDRAAKKLKHWRQVARSACEQSGQNRVASIGLPISFSMGLETTADWRLILDPGSESSLMSQIATQSGSPPGSVLILSGPEGGFSDEEITLAQSKGFCSVGLGPRILRTETAPLSAVSILQAQWGDWR